MHAERLIHPHCIHSPVLTKYDDIHPSFCSHSVTLITGGKGTTEGMDHEARENRMNEFRKGATRVLVTTDLLSRGIDVPAVSLVVNFDLPLSYSQKGEVEYVKYADIQYTHIYLSSCTYDQFNFRPP